MNGIDTLRKKYTALTPEERASLFFTEVATHKREEVALALRPSTTVEALKTSIIESVMLVVAGHALTGALLAERCGLAIIARRDGSLDDAVEASAPAWTESAAWALALERLQQETGLAFLAVASLLDRGAYLAGKIIACADLEVDISRQHDELLALWKTGKRQIESGRAKT
jgi:hypothetical protein